MIPINRPTKRTNAQLAEQLQAVLSWWERRTYVQGAPWTAKNEGMREARVATCRLLLAGYRKWGGFTERQRRYVDILIKNARDQMRKEKLSDVRDY